MLAQVLNIPDFEPRLLGSTQHGRDRDHLAVGKHVNVGEGWMRRLGTVPTAPNAVIEKRSSRFEQGESIAKVFWKLALAYVLHHSNAGNFVEVAQLASVAVVHQGDLALRGKSCFFDSLLCEH